LIVVIASQDIQKELTLGERVLWTGRPLGGLRFGNRNPFEALLGIFFFGFAVLWIYGASGAMKSGNPEGIFFPLFGIPFLLIGAYVAFGRYFLEAYVRKYVEYAVTDQRVIIRSGIFSRSTQSIDYRKQPTINLTEKSNKTGTIRFGDPPDEFVRGYYNIPMITMPTNAIEFISDARSVYNIIRKAAAAPA
jgi:hypothetical protein